MKILINKKIILIYKFKTKYKNTFYFVAKLLTYKQGFFFPQPANFYFKLA